MRCLVGLQGLDTCDLVPRLGAADVVRCIFETNVSESEKLL